MIAPGIDCQTEVKVNVAVTVLASLMLFMVQVATEAVPPVESQPVHATVE